MKPPPALALAPLLAMIFTAMAAIAADRSPNPALRSPGTRSRPAPGAEIIALDTHFGIDAKTGQMRKYTGTVHPDEVSRSSSSGEEVVLYVSPPISVENRYVPSPGAAPHPPSASFRRSPQPGAGQPPPAILASPMEYQPIQDAGRQPPQPQLAEPMRPRPAKRQAAQPPAVQQKPAADGKLPWWKGIFKGKKQP